MSCLKDHNAVTPVRLEPTASRSQVKHSTTALPGFSHMVSDKKIPIQAYVKHVTHGGGGGQFWPQGYNLNKLGRDSLGDASYQISRLYALWFQTRKFFMVFPI